MTIETIIADSLTLPADAIGYHISQSLAVTYPLKAIVEGSDSEFDIEGFAKEQHCRIEHLEVLHNQTTTSWNGIDYDLHRGAQNALFKVDWQGHVFEVLYATWTQGYCKSRNHWIVGETREVAEAFFRAVCTWSSEIRGEVLVFDGGRWHKSEELYSSIKNATFDNLVLPGFLKQEIQDDFAQFFASREVYERYRIPWKRGVLFVGPPGNGKTHTVKSLINWLNVPCLYVKSFKAQYSTEHDSIRSVFARARKQVPCILVFEDLDSLLNDKNRSFFLNELDGFAANTGVVVLASTNHPERLDPAILDRPSRFDRKYYFELPEPSERMSYIQKWNEGLEPDLRLTADGIVQVVDLTEGFSYAYLKELFLSSMMRWVASSAADAMDTIMFAQTSLLREQMSNPLDAQTPANEPDDDEDY